MADKGPNFKVEQLKLIVQVENLKVGLFRSELDIAEAEGRIKASQTNIESTHKAIAESEEKLKEFIKSHGDRLAKE